MEETERLLDALAKDLDAGFAELVRAYERTMYSVALRVTGSPSEAEDLTSESFLRAFRALREYAPDRLATLQPRAWLLTILLNTWRNRIREATRRVGEIGMEQVPDRPHTQPSVEDQVLEGESTRELGELLATLPPKQRSAVVLRHVVGLSMTEISRILECPEGTAKSHVSRGVSTLRKHYTSVDPRFAMTTTADLPLAPAVLAGAGTAEVP